MGKLMNSTLLHNRIFGLLLVFVLSIIMLAIFYGKLLFALNTTFFSTDGDGIQSYYNTYYLAKYDTSILYSYSMNYPYGEVSFYTLSQPLVAGTIKFISQNITDITAYTVGILNFMMLFSIILGAVFLYLFFIEINLSAWFAPFVSVGIAFLSPQIDRFPGHFTLSYVFAIPLLLYLLLLFHKRQNKILMSAITGIVLFVLMTFHVYYVAFFAIVIAVYWLFFLFGREALHSFPYAKAALYISFQVIIPVAIFYIITSHFSHLTPDRPSKPYGFLVYKASPESVLLPLGVDYGRIFHKMRNFNYVQWEGTAYVGMVAAIGFFMILAGILKKIFRLDWKSLLWITDNYFLNIIFWASLVTLLYSFGIPFIFGLEFLVEHMGPLQQLRAIGRFSWLFFYVINMVVFYRIWRYQQSIHKKYLRVIILLLSVTLLYVDVYYFLKNRQGYLNNKFLSWTDVKNSDTNDQWVRHIEPSAYQAILPMPFYHMGSDNYGINPRCNMLANSFLVSMKTGIPITAIYMSRASISQSIKNIAMVLEPYRELSIIKDFPVKKPFLIVSARCNDLTAEENNLLRMAVKIDSNADFNLYRLEFDSLKVIPQRRSDEMVKEITSFATYIYDKDLNDTASAVRYITFDITGTAKGYRGKALQIRGRSASLLYDSKVPVGNDSVYSISFWLNPVNKDLFPKTRLEIELFDNHGVKYAYKNELTGAFLKTIDDSWGLIEYSVSLIKPVSRIKIAVFNTQIGKKQLYQIDELLIRPENHNFYITRENYVSKNNRWFYAR